MYSDTIEQIERTVAVATLLNAPTFGVETFLAAAEIINARASNIAASGTLGVFEIPAEYDTDMQILVTGAESAAAYITCKLLPEELASYRTNERGANQLRTAWYVAKKYLEMLI